MKDRHDYYELLGDIQEDHFYAIFGKNLGKVKADIRADISGADNGNF